MEQEKSHVGMAQCFFCGKDSTILLDRRLKKSLPMKVGVIDTKPCNDCAGYMKVGVILISIADDTSKESMEGPIPNPYRTGAWAVVTQDYVERIFEGSHKDSALNHRFAFITDEAWNQLGLPKG
jgi:hypothetical protein